MNGKPYDLGALECMKENKLPEYDNLTLNRVRVVNIATKNLIALPIKLNNNEEIIPEDIDVCIQSLLDVVQQLKLKLFSIARTERRFDGIPWAYILDQLQRYFKTLPLLITICKALTRCPTVNERKEIINEKHASAIGGHKRITKTFNRIRQNYFWPNMKIDVQNFIQTCRECQRKKLTRIKTKQPMRITDTPISAFDKISMDVVGPLPAIPEGNVYIFTIQDLLTKYSVAVPLKRTNSLSIADAFLKHFICIYGAPKALLLIKLLYFLLL